VARYLYRWPVGKLEAGRIEEEENKNWPPIDEDEDGARMRMEGVQGKKGLGSSGSEEQF